MFGFQKMSKKNTQSIKSKEYAYSVFNIKGENLYLLMMKKQRIVISNIGNYFSNPDVKHDSSYINLS